MFNLSAKNDFALATGSVSIPLWAAVVEVGCGTGGGVGVFCAKDGAQDVKKTAINKMVSAVFLNGLVLIKIILFFFILSSNFF
jgi:Na+-driven multidrug efflux pump